jgi:hypothetical protein
MEKYAYFTEHSYDISASNQSSISGKAVILIENERFYSRVSGFLTRYSNSRSTSGDNACSSAHVHWQLTRVATLSSVDRFPLLRIWPPIELPGLPRALNGGPGTAVPRYHPSISQATTSHPTRLLCFPASFLHLAPPLLLVFRELGLDPDSPGKFTPSFSAAKFTQCHLL